MPCLTKLTGKAQSMRLLNKGKCTGWYIFVSLGPISIGLLFILTYKLVEMEVTQFSDVYNQRNIDNYMHYFGFLSRLLFISILIPIFIFVLIWGYFSFIKKSKYQNSKIRICRIMTVSSAFFILPFYYFVYEPYVLFMDPVFMKRTLDKERISSFFYIGYVVLLFLYGYSISIGASIVGGLIGYFWSRRVDQ